MSRSLSATIRKLIQYDPSNFDENFRNEWFTAVNDINHENSGFQIEMFTLILIKFYKKFEECHNEILAVKFLKEGGTLEHRNRDFPAAASFYTFAMLNTIPHSASAALAHASRAMVLKQMGQLQAAYDDCMIALSYNYPAHLSDITIFLLQAWLASKLSTLPALGSPTLMAQVSKEIPKDAVVVKKIALPKYRAMFANKTFASGERVFKDSAFVVLPSLGAQICSNCAAYMIVPFFCLHCKRFVVYCSLKCQNEHFPVHKFECQLWAFDKDKIEYGTMLVLRMFLTGLPQILHILAGKMNSYEMWKEIFENNQHDHIEYVRVLKSPSCWDLNEDLHEDLKEYVMLSKFLLTYLNCLNFFYNWQDFLPSKLDIMVFSHALLIRHFGQVRIGTHKELSTLDPNINVFTKDLKIGELVSFKDFHVTCRYYFPYKNICNHDCTPQLEFKIQGKSLTAYALKEIGKGEEITSTYCWLDIFKPRTKFRQHILERDYFFECQCQKCTDVEEDVEFYTICCLNKNCDANVYPLKDERASFKCPFCKSSAGFNIAVEKARLGEMCFTASGRVRVFKRLNKIKKLFFHISAPKADIYQHVLRQCVISHFDREPLSNFEVLVLRAMAQYAIKVYKKIKACSLVKMRLMVPYMELLAIQDDKPKAADLEECLSCIQEQPEAEKNFYMNYFEKFIKPRIKVSKAD